MNTEQVVDWQGRIFSKIRTLRESRGLSLRQLATRLEGITFGRLGDIENGRHEGISLTNTLKIIEALGYTPREFFSDCPPRGK